MFIGLMRFQDKPWVKSKAKYGFGKNWIPAFAGMTAVLQ